MKNKIVKLSLSLTKIVAISNLLLMQALVCVETLEEYNNNKSQQSNSIFENKCYNLVTKNFNDYMTNQGCSAKVQAIIEGLKLNTLNKDNKEKKNNFGITKK